LAWTTADWKTIAAKTYQPAPLARDDQKVKDED